MTYYILGTQTQLALAEIAATLPKDTDYKKVQGHVLFLETTVDAASLQERLGGIVKVGTIVDSLERRETAIVAERLALGMIQGHSGKTSFGISIYDFGNTSLASALERQRQAIGLTAKKLLKADGRSARYVDSKESTL